MATTPLCRLNDASQARVTKNTDSHVKLSYYREHSAIPPIDSSCKSCSHSEIKTINHNQVYTCTRKLNKIVKPYNLCDLYNHIEVTT